MALWILNHPTRFLALLAAAFMLPAFLFGPFGDDMLFHSVWSQEFSQEFWNGQLYPRWLSRMNSGCGGPDFFYYYPLFYFVTALFSFTDTGNGWLPMCIALWGGIALMGIHCHAWLSAQVRDRTAQLCGAAFYMLSPVAIMLVYKNFSVTAFLPYIWLPLLLHQARRIAEGGRNAVPYYALALAALYATSINGIIALAWLPPVWCLLCTRPFSPALILRLGAAQLLGTLLAAIYLLPMVQLLPHISTLDVLTSGRLHYANNFLFSFATWPEYVRGANTATSMIHLYFLLAILWFCWRLRRAGTAARREMIFWTVTALVLFVLMLSVSRPLWDAVSVMHYLQFPARLGNGFYPLILAFFLAHYFASGVSRKNLVSYLWVMSVMVLVSTFSLGYSGHRDLSRTDGPTAEQARENITLYSLYHSYRYFQFRRVVDDQYIPASVPPEWRGEKNADRLDALCKQRTRVVSGNADIAVKEWRSRHIALVVDAADESTLTVSQFLFPGWVARDAADPAVTYPLTVAEDGAIIQFTVPTGRHEIWLELETLPSERLGAIISAISLCILLIMVVYSRRGGKPWISASNSPPSA